jgi:hypothetical protein
MNEEKKAALGNIFRGLFVSERPGDITPTVSLRDVSTLFSRTKSEKYEEKETRVKRNTNTKNYEEVSGATKERVQRRYTELKNKRSLEKIANDILKTVIEIQTFEFNNTEYKKALNEYRSIAEARRHKEIMKVFEGAIGKESMPKIVDVKKEKDKSGLPLLLGGAAVGAIALMAPTRVFSKEIENAFDENTLKSGLEEINKIADDAELNNLDAEFSDLEVDFDIPDILNVRDTETTEIQTQIEQLQQTINEQMVEGAGPEMPEIRTETAAATPSQEPTIQTGQDSVSTTFTSRPLVAQTGQDSVSTTYISQAPSVRIEEPVAGRPIPFVSAPAPTPVAVAPPYDESGIVGGRQTPVEPPTAVELGRPIPFVSVPAPTPAPVAVARPYDESGIVGGRQTPVEPPPYDETERLRRRPQRPPTPVLAPSAPPPRIVPSGAPQTVTRVTKPVESIDEIKQLIAKTEGGALSYNAMNVPVIRNRNSYDEATRKKIYNILYKDAEIKSGNIDVTTGKKFEKDLNDMTMQEVISLAERRKKYYSDFKYDGKKVDLAVSGASGRYGFTPETIEDYASKLFGRNWKNELYDEKNQEELQTLLLKSNILKIEEQKIPISTAFLYMKHFFGSNSSKPLQIINADDDKKMYVERNPKLSIMSETQAKYNPVQAAMTVKQYKDDLIKKGFTFDPIDTKKLISDEERKKLQQTGRNVPKSVNEAVSDIRSKVTSLSTENIDSRRQSSNRSNIIIVQNNNTTVLNQRRVMAAIQPQQNINPGLGIT